MALGTHRDGKQHDLWVTRESLNRAPSHVFYDKLNELLRSIEFDDVAKQLCAPYYSNGGRPSIPPGIYFRMTLIGYFEGIDSQRGIAWRCQDSLSLRRFLGVALDEDTPVHSSMTNIRQRLPIDVHQAVFDLALSSASAHELISGEIGIDSTTLEANAAMRSIKRRDTFEDYPEYVVRLMREQGVIAEDEKPSAEERVRFDRQRKGKKASNKDWQSNSDPDARIGRMKNGSTHLMYKAEHAVDLNSGVILSAQIHLGNHSDAESLAETITAVASRFNQCKLAANITAIVTDKGYHTLAQLEALQELGVRVYVSTPAVRGKRVWVNKSSDAKRAFTNNRNRCRSERGKALHRKRGEKVERSFAHVCTTGGARRSWLRGIENINKRYLIVAAAHNLAAILRSLLGVGKPKQWTNLSKKAREAILSCFGLLRGLCTGLHHSTFVLARLNRCF